MAPEGREDGRLLVETKLHLDPLSPFPSQLGRLLRNLALCAALLSNDAVEPKTVELGVCQQLPQPQQTSGAGGDVCSQQSVLSTVEWRLATRMEM